MFFLNKLQFISKVFLHSCPYVPFFILFSAFFFINMQENYNAEMRIVFG